MGGRQGDDRGRDTDGQGGDNGQLAGQVGVGDPGQGHHHGNEGRVGGLGQEQGGHALHIGNDPPPLGHHPGQGGEAPVQEHQAGHGLGGGGGVAHGDPQVGVLEGQGVVDAVAGHGHHVPARAQGAHEVALLLGGDPAEHGTGLQGVGQGPPLLLLGVGQHPGVHALGLPPVGGPHAHAAGDRRHRGGVVPANDLDGHALLGEVAQGPGGVRADLLGQDGQDDGVQALGQAGLALPGQVPQAGGAGQAQDPLAGTGQVGDLLQGRPGGVVTGGQGRGQDDLGGPQDVVGPPRGLLHGQGGPLAGAGEGDLPGPLGGGDPAQPGGHGPGGRVGLLASHHGGQGRQGAPVGAVLPVRRGVLRARGTDEVAVVVQAQDLLELDPPGGQGAGLVQAQGVHPGQDLHGGQLLDQDVLVGQGQAGCGEVDAGQEHQALGDHADHPGHGQDDGVPPAAVRPGGRPAPGHAHLGPQQQQGHGDDHPADPGQDPVGARLELGGDHAVAAGLGRQAVGVGVGAHRVHGDQGGAGGHRGARHDPVARLLADGGRLPGEDGLVDLHALLLDHHAVGGHLVAAGDPDEVAQDDLGHAHRGLRPVTDDLGERCGQDRQAVQGPLGPDLGHRAGGRVDQQHEAEQGVTPAAHGQDDHQGGAEDGVEDGEDVGAQDLARGARGGLLVGVGPPGPDGVGDLGGAQAAAGRGVVLPRVGVRSPVRLGGRGCRVRAHGRLLVGIRSGPGARPGWR